MRTVRPLAGDGVPEKSADFFSKIERANHPNAQSPR
jgi:hypothetical protein